MVGLAAYLALLALTSRRINPMKRTDPGEEGAGRDGQARPAPAAAAGACPQRGAVPRLPPHRAAAATAPPLRQGPPAHARAVRLGRPRRRRRRVGALPRRRRRDARDGARPSRPE
jgi:hypothetical protein